jgi:hypothetical protein
MRPLMAEPKRPPVLIAIRPSERDEELEFL